MDDDEKIKRFGPIARFFWTVNPIIITVLSVKILLLTLAFDNSAKNAIENKSKIEYLDGKIDTIVMEKNTEHDNLWTAMKKFTNVETQSEFEIRKLKEEVKELKREINEH